MGLFPVLVAACLLIGGAIGVFRAVRLGGDYRDMVQYGLGYMIAIGILGTGIMLILGAL